MPGHEQSRIELVGEQLVLVCSCGWRSHPCADAVTLGAEWDDHRRLP
jgi:hypothetical protein